MGYLMCTMPCAARANVLMAQTRETTARWPCAKPARHLPKLNPDLPYKKLIIIIIIAAAGLPDACP